ATTGGSLRRMRSAFEDLGIAVGNVFLPTIAKGADALGGLALKASALVERFPKLAGAVAHAGAGIVGLAVGSLILGYAINTVKTGLNMARGAMLLFSGAQTVTAGTTRTLTVWQQISRLATLSWKDALTGSRAAIVGLAGRVAAFAGIQRGATMSTVAFTVAQKVMAAGSAIASGALRVLGMAVRFAMGPLGIILTALTLGAGLIIDNWDTVGPYFTAVWDGITGTFSAAWDFIKGIIDKVAAGIGRIGEKIDDIPVLGSAKRGLGKAWDWAFGDDGDKQAAGVAQTARTAQTAVPTPATAPPKPTAKGPDMPALTARESITPATMGVNALVPQRAEREAGHSRSRKSVNEPVPGLSDLNAQGGTSVTVPMTFTVYGLDAATFRQKMKECTSDFEAIVRRVVADMQHQKTRTAYAQ
ncbi:MAG: hypothetical protein K2O70_05840, partial [Desulfovibrionaceae bacterium]|nr:hypothetical protein [Desulfovibrionaceae bacterium]